MGVSGVFLVTLSLCSLGFSQPYKPDWSSLDSRPLPLWYDQAKFGIFIHWGVYSVPSFSSEWFWIHWQGNPSPNKKAQVKINEFMKANYKPGFSYQDFARDFTGEFFNASEWTNIIQNSGARYVVLTSKHHEGYTMWPSKYSYGWNSMDVGLHRDVVGELANAFRTIAPSVHFGLYHSLYEWFNPLWIQDKKNNFTTDDFVKFKVLPEMLELVQKYKPDVVWSDGEWEAPASYWKSEKFLAWLYNESPVKDSVVVNDRWGHNTLCNHGGYYTCQDRYMPGVLQPHKWENALTIDKGSWGYNRKSNVDDYMTAKELIDMLVQTVSCGGNMLLNVGPTSDGRITPIFQDRLSAIGSWLAVNKDAIFGTTPWTLCQNDTHNPDVWYTGRADTKLLNVIFLQWPKDGHLVVACPKAKKDTKASLIGTSAPVQIQHDGQLLKLLLPNKAVVSNEYAWVVQLESPLNYHPSNL